MKQVGFVIFIILYIYVLLKIIKNPLFCAMLLTVPIFIFLCVIHYIMFASVTFAFVNIKSLY